MEMIELECSRCKKLFERQTRKYRYDVKRGTKKFYCSDECRKKDYESGKWSECKQCGTKVWKTTGELSRSKTGNVFCSRNCSQTFNNSYRKAEKHPNYTNGQGSYRKRALETREHKCKSCGWDDDIRVLEVHHRDENRLHNALSNLVVLCPICHRKLSLGLYVLDENDKVIPKE